MLWRRVFTQITVYRLALPWLKISNGLAPLFTNLHDQELLTMVSMMEIQRYSKNATIAQPRFDELVKSPN